MHRVKDHSAPGADESGEIGEAKVKNAAEALWKLPEQGDGKIMGDEDGFNSMGVQTTGSSFPSAIGINFGGQPQQLPFLAARVARRGRRRQALAPESGHLVCYNVESRGQ